jgi:hypothetical protein
MLIFFIETTRPDVLLSFILWCLTSFSTTDAISRRVAMQQRKSRLGSLCPSVKLASLRLLTSS